MKPVIIIETPPSLKHNPRQGPPGIVRIIGGQWRSRRLEVLDLPGLRPTTDRVRETLFNWLQPVIIGSRCLDLFSGSGSLSFEAASRGAAEVVTIERDRQAASLLRQQKEKLRADAVTIIHGDALIWLQSNTRMFDIIFVDPPFGEDLLFPAFQLLMAASWMKTGGYIFFERNIDAPMVPLPESWRVHRQGKAGQVAYYVIKVGE